MSLRIKDCAGTVSKGFLKGVTTKLNNTSKAEVVLRGKRQELVFFDLDKTDPKAVTETGITTAELLMGLHKAYPEVKLLKKIGAEWEVNETKVIGFSKNGQLVKV